jgi:CBS-domain-containing membrane protein
MRRTWAIVLAVALAIGGGIFYLTRPGRPPAGQPPLVEIAGPSLAALHAEFNRTSSSLRIILLLSPT